MGDGENSFDAADENGAEFAGIDLSEFDGAEDVDGGLETGGDAAADEGARLGDEGLAGAGEEEGTRERERERGWGGEGSGDGKGGRDGYIVMVWNRYIYR